MRKGFNNSGEKKSNENRNDISFKKVLGIVLIASAASYIAGTNKGYVRGYIDGVEGLGDALIQSFKR